MCERDITAWISDLKTGDERAAQLIWQEYFEKLVRLARRRLEGLPRRAADEEDVALSAMKSFMQGAAGDRFPQLEDRTDLWKLLVTITARKAIAEKVRQRAKKRGGGSVRGESIFVHGDPSENVRGIGEQLGHEPTPEFAATMAENCRRLLDELEDETLRAVAHFKLEGFSNEEIGKKLGCATRTVERKLKRIRAAWSDQDQDQEQEDRQ